MTIHPSSWVRMPTHRMQLIHPRAYPGLHLAVGHKITYAVGGFFRAAAGDATWHSGWAIHYSPGQPVSFRPAREVHPELSLSGASSRLTPRRTCCCFALCGSAGAPPCEGCAGGVVFCRRGEAAPDKVRSTRCLPPPPIHWGNTGSPCRVDPKTSLLTCPCCSSAAAPAAACGNSRTRRMSSHTPHGSRW